MCLHVMLPHIELMQCWYWMIASAWVHSIHFKYHQSEQITSIKVKLLLLFGVYISEHQLML